MMTLSETTLISAPLARCFDLARSIEVHLAGNTHFGEQAVALAAEPAGATSGLLTLGDTVTWRARHFYIRQRLTTRITAYDPPHYFQDTMLRGAFRSMQHEHHFRIVSSPGSPKASTQTLPEATSTGKHDITEMRDIFRFSAPIPLLGRIAEALVLRRYMQSLLSERNAVIKQIAESPNEAWRQYLT